MIVNGNDELINLSESGFPARPEKPNGSKSESILLIQGKSSTSALMRFAVAV